MRRAALPDGLPLDSVAGGWTSLTGGPLMTARAEVEAVAAYACENGITKTDAFLHFLRLGLNNHRESRSEKRLDEIERLLEEVLDKVSVPRELDVSTIGRRFAKRRRGSRPFAELFFSDRLRGAMRHRKATSTFVWSLIGRFPSAFTALPVSRKASLRRRGGKWMQ